MANPTNPASEKPTCSICLDDINRDSNVSTPVCGHVYHKDCLDTWLKDHVTCPIDKKVIKANEAADNQRSIGCGGATRSARPRVYGCGGGSSQSSRVRMIGCGGVVVSNDGSDSDSAPSCSDRPRPRGPCG